MQRADYPEPFRELTRQLRRLPGVGPRGAERMALWLTQSADAKPLQLVEALQTAASSLQPCQKCGFFATGPLCEICQNEARCGREICVVEQATDILPLERTGIFRGLYHALGGRLAPLDQIGPENLRIASLLERVRAEHPTEIILALSADVEGEATTSYLADLLTPEGVKISRIAHGLPAGGGLEHADELTLLRALTGRNPMQ